MENVQGYPFPEDIEHHTSAGREMRSIATVDPQAQLGRTELDRHQALPRLKIPQDLPASLSRHVVPVSKHEDVYRDFQTQRERDFSLLIRRYIYQIRYGCPNPLCTTPTCLSYQKRTTKTPLRKFTRLSARTLACYLASQPNAEAALCPSCPEAHAEYEPVSVSRNRRRGKSHNVTFEDDGKPNSNLVAQEPVENAVPADRGIQRPKLGVLRSSSRDNADVNHAHKHKHSRAVHAGQHKLEAKNVTQDGPARDPKSFSQSLFETMPLRMLEWLPFSSLRTDGTRSWSSHDGKHRESDKDKDLNVKGSGDLSGRPGSLLNQKVLSAILRHPPSQPAPSQPFGRSNAAKKKPTRRDGYYLTSSELARVTMDAAVARTAEATKERERDTDRRPPASVPISPNPDSLPSTQPSPPCSNVSRHDAVQNIKSDIQLQLSASDHQRFVASGDQEDFKQDSSDHPPEGRPGFNALRTYTLERIPGQAFKELRSMQRKIEKQCLGHQSSERPSWMNKPKPHPNLALMFSDWNEFVQQSCFYVLNDSFRLARAFEWNVHPDEQFDRATWPNSILPDRGTEIFKALYGLRPSQEILRSLSSALGQVSVSTFDLLRPYRGQMQRDELRKHPSFGEQPVDWHGPALNNKQAVFVFAVVAYALTTLIVIKHRSFTPDHVKSCWSTFRQIRSSGRILPAETITQTDQIPDYPSDLLKVLVDVFEDEIALDLVSKLAKTVGDRVAFSEVSLSRDRQNTPRKSQKSQAVLHLLLQYFKDYVKYDFSLQRAPAPLLLPAATLEWLRTIILRDWDGQAIVRRAGSVGGSLQMLAAMYEERSDLQLDAEMFHTPFFVERLDTMEMPVEWLSYRSDNKTIHLLSYSFLFPPGALFTYFRALNFASMSKSFENGLVTSRHVSQFACSGSIPVANDVELLATMRPAMATYLVLNVRRDNVLTDAMNQLWRRKKRELMVPLKVKMGMDEGEEGVDHGGVQQEFFRCLLIEALDPAYGMFTVDNETRMTWFRPLSLEPLYKFEMLGILFSIAVYNSITLPVTFPLAFYRKLLGLPVKKLVHIQDGWPDLANGFQALLDWSEGDVRDVFTRTYDFSFNAFGKRIDVDMQRVSRDDPWPRVDQKSKPGQSDQFSKNQTAKPQRTTDLSDGQEDRNDVIAAGAAAEESPAAPTLVTNANRSAYVKDYIYWLTHKSICPQFRAFSTGFQTCLQPTALSIFTPTALRSVIEGSQSIDTDQLESVTRYEDGYHDRHPTVRDFWSIVHGFADDQKRGLLEFVTASDRVPVAGLAKVTFILQRSGVDDDRLPTSMTCFGRLLLPEYSSRQVMADKLDKAIENCRGFGVA